MQAKFVYFDLGNVLVHFDHEIAVQRIADLSQKEASIVRYTLFSSGLQDRFETGLLTSDEFASSLARELDCQLPSEVVLEAISAIFKPNEGIWTLLSQLKRHGVPMAVLSNTCEPHWQWILRQNWPVMQGWFEFAILSYEARSMKPAARIYELSEQQSGRVPENLFFTDDRVENVAAARERGWTTHQFTTVEKLAIELGTWLGLPLSWHETSPAEPAI